jgi:hypothetical protein
MVTWNSHAYPTYATGHINNITIAGDLLLIRLDTSMPDNCAGTAYNWIAIPAERKTMQAFVLTLQARGALLTQTVTIYTDAPGANGFCTVNQIDPAE